MLGTQRPHQRILDDIVRGLAVAGQRPRIAPQRRDRGLDSLPKFTQRLAPRPKPETSIKPTPLRALYSPAPMRLSRTRACWRLRAYAIGGWVGEAATEVRECRTFRASCVASAGWSWGSPTTARSAGASPRPAAAMAL